jgi:sialidase-1
LLETSSGTLLAFCEGRKKGQGDSGDIDLLLKRSQDGGATWGPQQVVWDEGADTCGNPCAVEDGTTREIILLLTRNDGRDREADIIDGKSRGTRTVWIAKSTTKGATWSPPVEITSAAKKPDWTWYATGPGAGIQLRRGKHEGRLVIPCDHIVSGTKKYYSHVILSDDHGKSWRIGGTSPVDGVNECQVAELDDGRLILNMRNYDRKQTCRAVCFSRDGGETWTDFGHDAALVEPICHASLIRLHGAPASDGGVLLFSNPADPKARRRMTLKLSRDGGRTWGDSLVLFEGPSAYSSLAALSDGSAGCLLEAGEKGPYETIIFRAVAVR